MGFNFMGVSRTARARAFALWAAKFSIHVGLLFFGLIIAFALRQTVTIDWRIDNPEALSIIRWAVIYAFVGGVVELFFQSERSSLRFASMREVVGLVRSVTITSGLFLGAIFFIDRGVQLPRSVIPLTWLVSLALLVGFRMVWRLPHDRGLSGHLLPSWWPKPARRGVPTFILGSMRSADQQLRMLQGDPKSLYQPVGVFSPKAEDVGLRLHGVPCVGALGAWLQTHRALISRGAVRHGIVFLDDPVSGFGMSTERIGELRRAGHILLKPQTWARIDGADDAPVGLKEIPLEDFLPRQPVRLDEARVRELVQGRRVLVTGAGGSIGSELCRQLLSLGTSHLSMVDHSEYLLFEIDRELARTDPSSSRRAILANVRDRDRIAELVRSERPSLIFHAAALKHVALVENNPAEGVLTNVLGTWNVLEAASASEVDQFVLISTDKAVAPSSVMGATKRIAESLLDMGHAGKTRMTGVRFGNVLGSAGSVVGVFRDQIARGGPVTVTHPDVNRFFMTIPEAVQLVLHSASIGAAPSSGSARKFLLEMGEPVKIADLARQMIELSGKIPDVDVQIVFTGLVPGEKISETLSDEGEEACPCAEGILELRWRRCADERLPDCIRALINQSNSGEISGEMVLDVADKIRSQEPPRSVESK